MAVIGELATLITARVAPFAKGLQTAGKEATQFATRLQTALSPALGKLDEKLANFASRLTLIGSAAGVGAIAWAGKLAMDFERAQVSFGVLLKDERKAASLMQDIQKFAAATPFSASEITEAAQKLTAYGYGLEEINGMLMQIGNTAAITGADMVTLAEILGRVRTQNRADLMDVNRIADRAGFFYEYLAKQLGVTNSEVRKLSQEGEITAKIFADAFRDMTTGRGALAGGLEKLSDTVYGKWTTLVDNIKMTLTQVGLEIFRGVDIKGLQDQITKAIAGYREGIVDATKEAVAWIAWVMETAANTADNFRAGKSALGAAVDINRWAYNRGMGLLEGDPAAKQQWRNRAQTAWSDAQLNMAASNSASLDRESRILSRIHKEEEASRRLAEKQYQLLLEQRNGTVESFR